MYVWRGKQKILILLILMKRIILSLAFIFIGQIFLYASDIQKCKQQIIDWHLSSIFSDEGLTDEIIALTDSGSYIDLSVKELFLNIRLPEQIIYHWVETQTENGGWRDIDYRDKDPSGWAPSFHVMRLFHLAKAYQSQQMPTYHSDKVLAAYMQGLRFWVSFTLTCPNWWYTEIGINKMLGPALLLMENLLPEDLKMQGVEQLKRSKIGLSGQNRVWLAGNVVYRALLQNDEILLKEARDVILSEIYITTEEGLQPDYSYHQHGPQLQFGNYGLAYALSMTYWTRAFRNTQYSFPDEKIQVVGNYILNGLNKVVWGGYMDYSACGRQFFKNAQRGKALALAQSLADMSVVTDAASAQVYKIAYRNILIPPSSVARAEGTTAFYRSDMLISKIGDAYFSVRLASPWTIATEAGNGENLKGYYMGEGVTSYMRNSNEYENIFPFWNWRRLPGITVPDDTIPLPLLTWDGYRNDSTFAGVLSSGTAGVAAMILGRDGISGNKGYFILGNRMFCLGNSLQTQAGQPLITTINSTYLEGGIRWRTGNNKMDRVDDNFSAHIRKPVILEHNGWRYYITENQTLNVAIAPSQGSWHEIARFYADKEKQDTLFTVTLNNDSGKYEYMVMPANDNNQEVDYSQVKITNTPLVQLVEDMEEGTVCGVCYRPGLFPLKKSLLKVRYISLSGQALFILQKEKDGGLKISLSDPTRRQKSISLGLYGKYESGRYDRKRNMTFFNIAFPQGDESGKSVPVVVRYR